MRTEHPKPFCWACGRGENQKPHWWYATWTIERSHIVNKPRLEDRRLVVLLCSGCHKTSGGERIHGWTLPRLTLANLLWLKAKFDPQFYDRAFVQRYAIRVLPRASQIAGIFRTEYGMRRHEPPRLC